MSEPVQESEIYSKRIVLIGDDGVGKTSVMLAYFEIKSNSPKVTSTSSENDNKPDAIATETQKAPTEEKTEETTKETGPEAQEHQESLETETSKGAENLEKSAEEKSQEAEVKVEEVTVEEKKEDTTEEPKEEEPKVEEPKVEEPKVEEQKLEEVNIEETKSDENLVQSPETSSKPNAEPTETKQENEEEPVTADSIKNEPESAKNKEENDKIYAEIDSKLTITQIELDKKRFELAIWDSDSENDFKDNRDKVYDKADVVIIFYSVDSPDSFENVAKKWKPEMKKYAKNTALILVGTKTDLRTDEKVLENLKAAQKQPVSSEDGKKLAKKIGAKFFECSAQKQEGLQEVFETAVRYGGKHTKSKSIIRSFKKGKCVIS